jgi:hypothetical protein
VDGVGLGAAAVVVATGADVAGGAVVVVAGGVVGALLGDRDAVVATTGRGLACAGLRSLACPLPGSSTAPTAMPATMTSTTAAMVMPVRKLISSSQPLTTSRSLRRRA